MTFLLSRLAGGAVVLLLVAVTLFTMLKAAAGDAADLLLPDLATPEDAARLRARWGLDQPVVVQFAKFVWNALHLDFGHSFRFQQPVSTLIAERLPSTLELALTATIVAVVVGLAAGLVSALYKGRLPDAILSLVSVAGVSAPGFWIGIMLVLYLSGELNLFPSGGRLPYGVTPPDITGLIVPDALISGQFALTGTALQYLALPAATLALAMVGIITRITRSAIIDVGQQEFVFTAVAKGLPLRTILMRHLAPNAAVPVITIIGLELGSLLSGSIIVEVVFSWPGLGTLLFQAVSVRDIPLVLGIVMTYTTIFIVLNTFIDVLYLWIDPRIRFQGAT
jgi:ABC-type dipeptide/oligopeptide/nickel transport system permease component